MKFRFLVSLILVLAVSGVANAGIANFDDLTLAADSYWSGNYIVDEIGGNYDAAYFQSGSADFENHSDGDYEAWGGFAYSNMTNTTTSGYLNQYSTYAGTAHSGSNFAVGYQDNYNGYNPTMILDTAQQLSGLYVTNTTYAALSMYNGDGFAKKFGGVSGDDEDWFLLTITGKDSVGDSTGTVEFYLADYRFVDSEDDYIIEDWMFVNLSALGVVTSVEFTFSSSDVGGVGTNTPTYFAMDSVPEPTTIALLGLGGLMLRRRKRA